MSPLRPFGLRTFFPKSKDFHQTPQKLENPVKIFAKGMTYGFVERKLVPVNQKWIDVWKVYVPRANNIGTELPDDNLNSFVGEPNSICTESYLVVGADKNYGENECKNLARYLQTRFVRFLHSLAKSSQDATAKTYRFVPLQDFTSNSDIDWNKSISEIDQQLYKKYRLTQEEIEFIESMIRPME